MSLYGRPAHDDSAVSIMFPEPVSLLFFKRVAISLIVNLVLMAIDSLELGMDLFWLRMINMSSKFSPRITTNGFSFQLNG